jgi:hypothetical protein
VKVYEINEDQAAMSFVAGAAGVGRVCQGGVRVDSSGMMVGRYHI